MLVFDVPDDQSGLPSPLARIEHVWSGYTDLDVSPLLSEESAAKGARIERLEDIPGLKEIV